MTVSRWQHPLLVWGGWILFAIFVKFGPTFVESKLSSCIMDGAGQSLRIVDQAQRWARASSGQGVARAEVIAERDGSTELLQKQNRDLAAMIVMLQAENERLRSVPNIPVEDNEQSLRKTTAIQANVIGRRSGSQHLLVSLGERHGLLNDELVLEGEGVLIDQGSYADLTRDQLVSLGRSLFGRTVEVGRWTSLVQPVTHPEFRTAVRLVRVSEFGTVTGAEGILKGTGTGCEMIEVVGTHPVAVGDLVYTDPHVSPTSIPIYCGRVTQVNIASNDSHWTIIVSPPHPVDSIPIELSVLKVELNVSESR